MAFGQLPALARTYVLAVYAAAAGIAGLELLGAGTGGGRSASTGSADALWLFTLVLLAASLAHSFPVSVAGRQAFHVSLPFFVVGIVLLSPVELTVLLATVNAVEWIQRRMSWFAHVFNIAAFVLAGALAQGVYTLVSQSATNGTIDLSQPGRVLAGLTAIATFALVNRVLVAAAVWMGNGVPPRQQHMFTAESVLTDAILLIMGLAMAQLAVVGPWVMVLGATPLLLIHRALDIPNLRAQRSRDALTELSTVASFRDMCARELSRSERFGRPVALLLVDLDRLGEVNANHGHHVGDRVIQETGRLLEDATREYDLATRVVGGQYAILLPETDMTSAIAAADHMRLAVAQHPYVVPTSMEPLNVTVSVGVAGVVGHHAAVDELFAATQSALERAKQSGRDRIGIARMSGTRVMTKPSTDGADLPPIEIGSSRTGPDEPTQTEPVVCCETSVPPNLPEGGAAPRQSRCVALALGVTLAAAALVLLNASAIPQIDPVAMLLLISFVALSESRALGLFENSSYSVSAAPVLAAGMLLGVPGAVVVAMVAMPIRARRRVTRWYKLAFNVGLQVLAAAGAGAVYEAVREPLLPYGPAFLIVPGALAGFVYYLHTVVVAFAMSLELRVGVWKVWAEHFRWLLPQYMVLSLLALLLALAYREFGLVGALAFVAPALMMRFVAKQYVDRTVGNVRQLRALNAELAEQIAQRAAAEKEIARLAREAASAEAAQEVARIRGELMSVVSHEMRTPLGSLIGFTELLMTRDLSQEERHECLTLMYEEGHRLASLINDFLDLQRMESNQQTMRIEPVDLAALAQRVARVAGDDPDRPIELNLPPDLPAVPADPDRLEQVLLNLLSNARKYSPDGGHIELSIRQVGGFVEVVVEDRGLGLPAEAIPHLFDKFFRVDNSDRRKIQGTGLGLAIVKQIVVAHGGQVWAESDGLGQGARFCFTLPLAHAPARQPPGQLPLDGTPEAQAA